jgi:hypothetical protein
MLAQRPTVRLAAPVALWLTLNLAINSYSAETATNSAEATDPIALARPAELDALGLTAIDRKLALSLAVEIYLQVTLNDDVADRIQDPDLKRLTQRKLRLYRATFAAFDRLAEGRAAKLLTEAGHQVRVADSDAKEPGDDDSAAPHDSAAVLARGRLNEKGDRELPGGGLRYVLSRISEIAILQARIEISGQYEDIWHAELEPVPAAEFDRRYLSTESVNQMQVVGMLRACERRASCDFAQIIRRATASAEDQLAECLRLARRIEGGTTLRPNTAVRVTVKE